MEEANETMSVTRRCVIAVLCERTSLFLLVTGYTLLGAVIFKTIEGGETYDAPVDFKKSREDCLKELWIITERLNVLYEKNWTKLVTEQLKRFERTIVESGKHDSHFDASRTPWTFGSALLYSITLLTTVGYSRLSPKTVLGKVSSMVYAIVGVPLMLILLSALGGCLAKGARRGYSKICCYGGEGDANRKSTSTVGYRKASAPASSTGRFQCKSHEDSGSIQIAFPASSPQNHIVKLSNHHSHHNHHRHSSPAHLGHQDVPKRALLATVRAGHARGRSRQPDVRQTLMAAATTATCPAHATVAASDPEDAEETDDNELSICPAHDTPSRVPLIWRPPEPLLTARPPPPRPVPALLVAALLAAYVCAGAALLCAARAGCGFLDAVYVCFIALSTVGLGAGGPDAASQAEMVACCAYVFVGLVVVAMSLSLVHEEVAARYRHAMANSVDVGGHY